jgi:hypothetical protein
MLLGQAAALPLCVKDDWPAVADPASDRAILGIECEVERTVLGLIPANSAGAPSSQEMTVLESGRSHSDELCHLVQTQDHAHWKGHELPAPILEQRSRPETAVRVKTA